MSIGRTVTLAMVMASPNLEAICESDHRYNPSIGVVWNGRVDRMVVLCRCHTMDVLDFLGHGLCQWILFCLDSNRRCMKK